MKAVNIKDLRSIGLENYYQWLWNSLSTDEEYTSARAEIASTPEDLLPDTELNAAITALEDEQSARIMEAMGHRAYFEIDRAILDPASEQFLKGYLKGYVKEHGTFLADPELSSLIKSFN